MSKILPIIALLISNLATYAQQEGAKKTPDLEQVDTNVKKRTLNLVVGIKKIIKINFDADFTNLLKINNLGDKLEMRPVPSLNEIIFEGKEQGNANIIIKDKAGQTKLEYNVIITKTNQSKIVQELRELIGDIEGIEIEIKANKVVVDGEIIVPKDIGRLVVAMEHYQDVLVFVEPSPHTMEIIAKKMQNEIQDSGIKNVTVRVVNDTFWLEGVVNDRNGKRIRAYEIAVALLPERISSLAQRNNAVDSGTAKQLIQNFIEEDVKSKDKPLPKLVKIAAQFVEISKDYARTFGFRWSPTFSGGGGAIAVGKTPAQTLSTSSDGSLTAVIQNLFPKLAAARNAGNARILQSGMVVTENSVKTTISKSTEIPFSLGTGEFTKGEKAMARFKIETTPDILKDEQVKLANLNISISVVIGQTLEGSPLVTSNDLSTSLIVNSGDSAVVGGVFQSHSSAAYDKLPGGGGGEGKVDYLFNFIRAKDYKTSKNQFVVFVTPEIIGSASKGTEEIKRKFRRRSR